MIDIYTVNKQRYKRTRAKYRDRIIGDPDDTDPDAQPSVASEIGLNLIAEIATLLHAIVLAPKYLSPRESIVGCLKHRPWAYLPHMIVATATGNLHVAYPGLYLMASGIWYTRYFYWALGVGAENIWNPGPRTADLNDPSAVDDDRYWLPASDRRDMSEYADYEISLDKGLSTLALGESGSGKSSALKMMAAQLSYDNETAVISHGKYGEYNEFYRDLGLNTITISDKNSDAYWNLFDEIDPDADEIELDRRFRQIAATLITTEDTNSPFFPKAAQGIFVKICMILWERHEHPHHGHIKQILDLSSEEVAQSLEDAGYGNTAEVARENEDVWSTMHTELNRVFAGDFAREGSFSFREYVRNPQGRVVVLETPQTMNFLGATFATLADQMIHWANRTPEKRTIALLDELDSISRISNFGSLASEGRGYNSVLLAGTQTVGQLKNVYEGDLSSVLGNTQQKIALRPGDTEGNRDLKYTQSIIGKQRKTVKNSNESITMRGELSWGVSEQEVDRCPIPEAEITTWRSGEGIIMGDDEWWYGRLGDPDEWIPKLWEIRGSADRSVSDRAAEKEVESTPPGRREGTTGWDDEQRKPGDMPDREQLTSSGEWGDDPRSRG